MIARADAQRLPFADRAFDLVIGSPPYIDARLYLEDGEDLGISRDTRAWVDWMLLLTAEAQRVSKGLVLWVCAGVTRGRNYQPGPEGLLWRWWERGGECHCLRPVIWHRSGIPGSGGDQWFRADTEYVLAFKRPGKLPWALNTANGQPPRWAPGGKRSHRLKNGKRCYEINWKHGDVRDPNQHYTQPEIANPGNLISTDRPEGTSQGASRPSHRMRTSREPDGSMRGQDYVPPDLANPGNLLLTDVGGGRMGHPLAHDNEAPYPVAVPAWFIASHCPPGGLVLDPFSGSGTTAAAALSLGRRGVGSDVRQSQCRLSRKRLATVTPGFCFTED